MNIYHIFKLHCISIDIYLEIFYYKFFPIFLLKI